MSQTKFCDGCPDAHDCKRIYERLGHQQGPPVTGQVTAAFVVPIMVFVAGLGGFGRLLQGTVATRYVSPLALACSLVVTVAAVVTLGGLLKRSDRKR
jgi:hypothetical protein